MDNDNVNDIVLINPPMISILGVDVRSGLSSVLDLPKANHPFIILLYYYFPPFNPKNYLDLTRSNVPNSRGLVFRWDVSFSYYNVINSNEVYRLYY